MARVCMKCLSQRIVEFSAKSSDCNSVRIGEKEHQGYVPDDMAIGGGDYVSFHYCLECGKIQGEFPIAQTAMESSRDISDE